MAPTVLEILHPAAGLQANRRATLRFPFEAALRYTVHGVVCAGKAINIGSHGILLTTETELPVGRNIEIEMLWPVLLNGDCPLKFIAKGQIVRSDATTAAVHLENYQFRTRGGKMEVAA